MIKITKEMVCFWLGDQSRQLTIKDFKDLANGDYPVDMLKMDILRTWKGNTLIEKKKWKGEINGK